MTPDELVEKVALAICEDAGMAQQCRIPCAICKVDARATIAVVLEEAARVCERRFMGDNTREDMEARRCAAAIRALVTEPRDE